MAITFHLKEAFLKSALTTVGVFTISNSGDGEYRIAKDYNLAQETATRLDNIIDGYAATAAGAAVFIVSAVRRRKKDDNKPDGP